VYIDEDTDKLAFKVVIDKKVDKVVEIVNKVTMKLV